MMERREEMKIPTVTLEVSGLEELTELLEKASQQIADLKNTIHQINIAALEVNAKRNQPKAATND